MRLKVTTYATPGIAEATKKGDRHGRIHNSYSRP